MQCFLNETLDASWCLTGLNCRQFLCATQGGKADSPGWLHHVRLRSQVNPERVWPVLAGAGVLLVSRIPDLSLVHTPARSLKDSFYLGPWNSGVRV